MKKGAPWEEEANRFLMRYFEAGIERAYMSDGLKVADNNLLKALGTQYQNLIYFDNLESVYISAAWHFDENALVKFSLSLLRLPFALIVLGWILGFTAFVIEMTIRFHTREKKVAFARDDAETAGHGNIQSRVNVHDGVTSNLVFPFY